MAVASEVTRSDSVDLARRSATSRRRLRCAWGLAATGALCGCSPKVIAFNAVPRHICPGERVELTWEVTGSASITITPLVPGLPRDVKSKGQAFISPTVPTHVELHATRCFGSPKASAIDIDVRQAAEKPEPLAASVGGPGAGCGDGKVWATVEAKRFAPTVLVQAVTSHPGDHRSYSIAHSGRQATLAPGAVANDFIGLPVAGAWVLTSPLEPGESCGPSLPHNLTIDVLTSCIPGGKQ